MKPSDMKIAGIFTPAGLIAALAFGSALPALAEEPCAELKLSGATVMELPCPEELGRFLDSPLLRQQPDEDGAESIDPEMAIEPDWPHDEAMVAERDWPHDQAMVVPRATKPDETPPALDEFMGLLGRFLSRQPQQRLPLEPQLRNTRYSPPAD